MSALRRVAVRFKAALRILTILIVLIQGAVTPVALGQAISLSAEQQRMLNQLPPAQREQALAALRQQQAAASSAQSPSINESLSVSDNNERPDDENTGAAQATSSVRARAGSRLVIDFLTTGSLSSDGSEAVSRNPTLRNLPGSRYFELDSSGTLTIPGLSSIPLLGLTERQIELRLGAEPSLRPFAVSVNLLDSEEIESTGLEPFGYGVFESSDYGFRPVTSGPVPPEYVLGAGDSVRVQFFGSVNAIHEIEVSRDGVLNLPELGPITVAGLSFSDFRQDIGQRVQEMLIGTQVSVTMGQLRSMRVFVLGDANRPGSYVVNSMATISGALYASGGVSRIGSLRDIQLKRSGRLVQRLDVYDLLLKGDTSGDARLQPGDVVFVPPIGDQVTVSGAVNRPAIYETRGEAVIAEIIALAGGLKADAYLDAARIERIDSNRERITLSIGTGASASSNLAIRNGDALFVPEVLPDLEYTVTLAGHVQRPGPYQWRSGMRLSDLVRTESALLPNADSEYVLIRRENPETRHVEALSANLTEALAAPSSAENIVLRPRDSVHVFDLAFGRQRVIDPILEELKLQARFGEPFREVSVSGRVLAPGTYPLEPGMRVSDLVRAGGSLSEQAYTLAAELVRYEVVGDEYRSTDVIEIDLASALRGEGAADLTLMEHDNLRISGLPEWDTLWTVEIDGEVTFPGDYRIRRGETLAQVVARAGGLTNAAFPEGAVFLRDSLKEREQEQIRGLARRLEADLTALSLQNADTTGRETLTTGRELLGQLETTEAAGRLVIDLDEVVGGSPGGTSPADLELRDGDRLLVPKQAQEVTVIGETQQNTSHLYRPELSRDDYIGMSGGLTRRADRGLIYIVRANGAVVSSSRSKWFGRGGASEIRPGDTIVVPLETDRIRPLTFWTNVTQILYQAAIAVAAIETFSN